MVRPTGPDGDGCAEGLGARGEGSVRPAELGGTCVHAGDLTGGACCWGRESRFHALEADRVLAGADLSARMRLSSLRKVKRTSWATWLT